MSTTPRDRHDPRGTTSPDATGPAPRTQAGETAQAPATAPGRPAAPDPLSDYVAQVRAHLGAAAPALAEDLAELDASLIRPGSVVTLTAQGEDLVLTGEDGRHSVRVPAEYTGSLRVRARH